MQTVTLEFRTEDLVLLGVIPPTFFEKYEEVELLETLRLERGWRLQLLRIRRRGPLRTAEELGRESGRIRKLYGLERFELVERRPRTRDYIIVVRQRNPPVLRALVEAAGGDIAATAPFRLTESTTVATIRGEEAALRKVTGRLAKEGLEFRVVRTSSRPFLTDAASTELTGRQREVLTRAWALGYYAIPRRITLTRLSRLTGQSPVALGKMLRRVERHLVARHLSAEPPFGESSGAES